MLGERDRVDAEVQHGPAAEREVEEPAARVEVALGAEVRMHLHVRHPRPGPGLLPDRHHRDTPLRQAPGHLVVPLRFDDNGPGDVQVVQRGQGLQRGDEHQRVAARQRRLRGGGRHLHEEPEARRAMGIGDRLVRLSVGIEGADDLIRDFETALAAA